MATIHGYHAWLPCMATIHGYHPWLPSMATIHGYHPWLPSMATIHGYHPWLPCMATIHGYHPWLPSMATMHGVGTVLCFCLHRSNQYKMSVRGAVGGAAAGTTHSNSAVRTRVITNYAFSHASVHITKRALTINVIPLFFKLHRPILYGNIIKRPFNPLLTYD